MIRPIVTFASILALAACNATTNPIFDVEDTTGEESIAVLPGTDNPSTSRSIERHETDSLYSTTLIRQNADGTLTVEGLPFDGEDAYELQNAAVGQDSTRPLFSLYAAAPTTVEDDYDGAGGQPISQDSYLGLVATSDTGNTYVKIIRTGSYSGKGYGGFSFGREGGVNIPTVGQANYVGNYAGLRVFTDRAGIETVQGLMEMEIDFTNLDGIGAVWGQVYNRIAYSQSGTQLTTLPPIYWVISPNAFDKNGEMTGDVASVYYSNDGSGGLQSEATTTHQTGTYSAVISGSDAEEIAGVIVLDEADYIEFDSYVTQNGTTYATYTTDSDKGSVTETGGFILER